MTVYTADAQVLLAYDLLADGAHFSMVSAHRSLTRCANCQVTLQVTSIEMFGGTQVACGAAVGAHKLPAMLGQLLAVLFAYRLPTIHANNGVIRAEPFLRVNSTLHNN